MRRRPHHVVAGLAPMAILAMLLAGCAERLPASDAPGAANEDGQARCPALLTVYAGDTVYSVARRCGVSVRDLIDRNRLEPPYMLSAGMRIRIPGGGGTYTVQRGDTLLRLAYRFHVRFSALADLNGKHPPYGIRVGEHLRIPGLGAGTESASIGSMVVRSPNAGGPMEAPSPPIASSGVGMASPIAPPAQPANPQTTPTTVIAPPVKAREKVAVPPAPQSASGLGFLWPVAGRIVVPFGPLGGKGQNNDGINIAATEGAAVHAAENGVVAYVGNELKGFGNLILIKHSDGWMTAYAHAGTVLVRRGDTVRRGQTIATVGATGSVSSPQLHFEMRHGTEAVDPVRYLRGEPVGEMSPPRQLFGGTPS